MVKGALPRIESTDQERGALMARVSRGTLLKGSIAAVGALAGIAVGGAEFAASADSGGSAATDREILTFGLLIERLQAAFYAAALAGGSSLARLGSSPRSSARRSRHTSNTWRRARAERGDQPPLQFRRCGHGPREVHRDGHIPRGDGSRRLQRAGSEPHAEDAGGGGPSRIRRSPACRLGARARRKGSGTGRGRRPDHGRPSQANLPTIHRAVMPNVDPTFLRIDDFDVDGAVREAFEQIPRHTRSAFLRRTVGVGAAALGAAAAGHP